MRRYGYLHDELDRRDRLSLHYGAAHLPKAVDLRPQASPIRDQTTLGACTAFAICALMEQGKALDLSELFLYYEERATEGTIKADAGAMLRDGLKAAQKIGVPRESFWKYVPSKFAKAPPQVAVQDAANHRIKGYQRVPGIESARALVASGRAVAFGMTVFESFEDTGPSGKVPIPKDDERPLGGHAMSLWGYTPDHAIVRNQWGTSFGDHGWLYIPLGMLVAPRMDFWVLA